MASAAALRPSPSSLHWFTSHCSQTMVLPGSGLAFKGSVTPIVVGSFLFSAVAAVAAATPLPPATLPAVLPPVVAPLPLVVAVAAAVVAVAAPDVAAGAAAVVDELLLSLPHAAMRPSAATTAKVPTR